MKEKLDQTLNKEKSISVLKKNLRKSELFTAFDEI
jgi:hypothetical protein